MTVVLKSAMYAWASKRLGEMSPGPVPSFLISAEVSVSVIRSLCSALPRPGPNQVAGRDDADRCGRGVSHDEAVDSMLLHHFGGLLEARGGGDGEHRLGHYLPDREAEPIGDEILVCSSPNEVGLAQDPNKCAAVIQDRKTRDLVAVQDSDGFREGRRHGDGDEVGSHHLANGSMFGHRATVAVALAAAVGTFPATAAVTSITPS